jgi:hypothetical protein
MFESSGKLPRIPQPGPLPAGAKFISTLSKPRLLHQEPLVVFRLQSSWLTMQNQVKLSLMDYIILVYSDVHDARKFAWTGPFRNAVRVGLDCSRGMERTV